MTTVESRFRERLLVERIAARCGFDALADRLPGPNVYPPYLFVAVALFLDFGVVNTYKHLTGSQHALLATPTVIAGPLGLVLAAVGIRYMSDAYADAIGELRIHNRDVETDMRSFETTVSLRTKLAVYGLAVAALYGHIFFNVGVDAVVAFEGLPGLVNWLVIWELAYLPFVVEFALIYVSVHVLVPRRVRRADLGLFYYDPRNMGGFAAVGQLLKRSYYLFTAGLLLFFLLTYGAAIFGLGETATDPGTTEALFFSSAWLLGVLSIGYSMLTMHRIMAAEKEERIRDLEAEIREVIENPYDITDATVTDPDRLEDVERRLDQVRATKAYPATFTMWSQIALSVLLPQALQLAVRATA